MTLTARQREHGAEQQHTRLTHGDRAGGKFTLSGMEPLDRVDKTPSNQQPVNPMSCSASAFGYPLLVEWTKDRPEGGESEMAPAQGSNPSARDWDPRCYDTLGHYHGKGTPEPTLEELRRPNGWPVDCSALRTNSLHCHYFDLESRKNVHLRGVLISEMVPSIWV